MQRFFIVFLGRVQGVGFRYTLARIADKYHITGWVANRYDEAVECEIQGEKEAINALLKEILTPSRFIRVDDYHIKPLKIKENEKEFIIRY